MPTEPAPTPESTPLAPDWRERTDIAAGPSARLDHTWTVADSNIAYLFGGRVESGASDELWQFDLATDSWSLVAPTTPGPEARWGHTGTWVPGVGLVVWSGQNENGFFGDIWRFDPQTGGWEQLPSAGAAPEPRYGSCAALGPDGRLWISHGFTEDAGRFADTRAYDFAIGEWVDETPSSRVPLERCLHDCFWSAEGQFVLYAGQTTGIPSLGDAWAYDLASGDWTASAEGAAPARQLYAMAPAAVGALVFGGGALEGNFLDDAWLLDAATLALTPLEVTSAPPGRAGATLIAHEGRYLLFGGQGDDGLLSDMWEIGSP